MVVISGGVPVVIDTGAPWLNSHTVRLEGVRGVAGDHARQLTMYIADREVECRRTEHDQYWCEVDGWNLSEVVLYNGGGRAAADSN